MSTKTTLVITAIIVAIMFAVGLAAYPLLPERVASHWNAQGQVNGYSSRGLGTFLMPGMMLILSGFFMLLPALDPLRSNIEKFRAQYNSFVIVFALFMLYIHLLTLAWNLGYRFDLTVWMVPALGGLMYLMGMLMGHARRNYFIGIRTPWTLHSETVWNKTHARGAVAFKFIGVLTLLAIFFPNALILFLILPLGVVTFYLTIYSYILFRQEQSDQNNQP